MSGAEPPPQGGGPAAEDVVARGVAAREAIATGPSTFPRAGRRMAKHSRTFPGSGRAGIAAALVAVVCVTATIAGAAPSKRDVEQAKRRLQRIATELGDIRDQLAAAQARAHQEAVDVERAVAALERTQTNLQRTRARLVSAQRRYDEVTERLNDRAVEAYMVGPATGLDFVLGAESVAELTDRLAYADALAQADAELAVEVANRKNELIVLQTELERQRAREARDLERQRREREEVLDALDGIESLLRRQQGLLAEARRIFRDRKRAYQDYLEAQVPAATGLTGGRTWDGGSLPAPYDRLFEACPVDQPRGFGDGFGAARYGGGFHLHKGVDIVAPTGTTIRAPFDGYAHTSSNGLGGSVVFVVGSHGTVYNAHLSGYTERSTGPVSAGDPIGLVGSTGYSTVPHDHFEFHPNAVPASWPQSAYGYSVIEDAINPYPMLIQACG